MSKYKPRNRRQSNAPKKPSAKPMTVQEWWQSHPDAKVGREEFMRVLEGMDFVGRETAKKDTLDLLRDYEQMRRWRRIKAVWRWIMKLFKRTTEKRSLEDLSADGRQKVREELERVEREIAAGGKDPAHE